MAWAMLLLQAKGWVVTTTAATRTANLARGATQLNEARGATGGMHCATSAILNLRVTATRP